MTAGIYAINHIPTGMKYIGSSKCVKTRISNHKRNLRNNNHHSRKLQELWNDQGKDNFVFYQIESCHIDKLIEREQFWIDFFNSAVDGLNILFIAGQSPWKDERFKNLKWKAKKKIQSLPKTRQQRARAERERIAKEKLKREKDKKENAARMALELYIKRRSCGVYAPINKNLILE